MSSVLGSLAWDADDLDGELCLGAGVGAAQRPYKEMKPSKCLAANVRTSQKPRGPGYVPVKSLDSSSYHR